MGMGMGMGWDRVRRGNWVGSLHFMGMVLYGIWYGMVWYMVYGICRVYVWYERQV
jgi:hypothetical protein